jgi:Bacteriocin-protection, YdeI or OmpD-Associated/Domain of unknown function (DUF1905)
MRFRASIELHGKTATGIVVPPEVVESLQAGKRPPVRLAINGHTYRSTVAPMAGQYRLPISAEHRSSSGVEVSDEVEVEIELDTQAREVEVPPDLREALDRDADAKRCFDGLSYSNKQRIVLSIEGAKTSETRLRRITKAISELREGRV